MISSSSLLLLLVGASLSLAQVRVFDLRASKLPSLVLTTDGYVKVYVGSKLLGQTSVRYNDANPWWKEEFNYFNALENDELKLEVHDKDVMFDDLLGTCRRLLQVGTYEHDCFLEKGGTLHYSYTLSPVRRE